MMIDRQRAISSTWNTRQLWIKTVGLFTSKRIGPPAWDFDSSVLFAAERQGQNARQMSPRRHELQIRRSPVGSNWRRALTAPTQRSENRIARTLLTICWSFDPVTCLFSAMTGEFGLQPHHYFDSAISSALMFICPAETDIFLFQTANPFFLIAIS
jgi:hypothetical protein